MPGASSTETGAMRSENCALEEKAEEWPATAPAAALAAS
jgi:hypothetical protein